MLRKALPQMHFCIDTTLCRGGGVRRTLAMNALVPNNGQVRGVIRVG